MTLEQSPTQTHGVDGMQGIEMSPRKEDVSHLERVLSPSSDLKKDGINISRVDKEVQQYALQGQVEIDEATNRRLRRMIDRRVLVVMIFTYFIQALDKGTLSFTSIMGLQEDTHLHGQQVRLVS